LLHPLLFIFARMGHFGDHIWRPCCGIIFARVGRWDFASKQNDYFIYFLSLPSSGRMLLLGIAVLNYCIFSAFRRISPLPPFDLLLLGLSSLFRFLGASTFAYAFYYVISLANVYSQVRELALKGTVDRYF